MRLHLHASEHPINELADVMGQMIEQMARRDFYKFSAGRGWQPAINLYETRSAYVLCMDLAGMKREDIDVGVVQGKLVIQGDRPNPRSDEMDDSVSVHVMEILSGPFRRDVPLPSDIDDEAIQARYRDGFLWLVMPRPENQPTQK